MELVTAKEMTSYQDELTWQASAGPERYCVLTACSTAALHRGIVCAHPDVSIQEYCHKAPQKMSIIR